MYKVIKMGYIMLNKDEEEQKRSEFCLKVLRERFGGRQLQRIPVLSVRL